MSKSQKLLSVLQFAILLMVLASFVWSFFNPYASIAYIPLIIISIYYLLWYLFIKMVPFFNTNKGYYFVLAFVILPILVFMMNKEVIVNLSIHLLNMIQK